MNFKELDPPVIEIPKQQKRYRIQRQKTRKDSIRNNGFILPPMAKQMVDLTCRIMRQLTWPIVLKLLCMKPDSGVKREIAR
jgi:hypothetical protein